MNILLTYIRYDGDVYMDSYEQDHLGLGYIASVLRNSGHNVKIINAHFLGLSIEELIEEIEPLEFDIVGIPVHVETLFDLFRFTEWISKNKNANICIGGHWAGTEPEKLLEILPKVDYVITGEGEYTFLELVEAIEQKKDLHDVLGIAWRKDGSIVLNPRRPLIEDLDKLPYPARDSIEVYNKPYWSYKKRTANMLASRGCYANCSFCSIKSFYNASPGKKIRFRDPIKLVDEIEYLVNNYRVNQIFFSDDNFRAPDKLVPDWSATFARELINRNLGVNFIILSRVNDIDKELYSLLKKAGLVGVAIGVESDVERMLETYRKKTSKEINRQAINILRELKIDPLISFMMFDPYSTLDELKENLDFFRDINYVKYFHYTRPLTLLAGYDLKTYGGTPLTEGVTNDGFTNSSNFAYECNFEDYKVAQVFDLLQQWRPSILKVIMHNPLWLIDIANRLGEQDILYRLHAVSRKVIKFDALVFDKFIEMAERGHSSNDAECQELLRSSAATLDEINQKFVELEEMLSEKREKRSLEGETYNEILLKRG